MEAAREGNFHLAILDISMPYHTGIEVIKCIREREAKEGVPYVPAFALTGHSSAEDRRACLDAGFDEFITKPFNTVFLMDAIKNMIAAHPAVSSL
jgi:CheY-like chemotaxis protein